MSMRKKASQARSAAQIFDCIFGAPRARRYGKGPELVAEGDEHDGLPAAVYGRFGVEGLGDDSPARPVHFWAG
jgi:hypothetical protein